MKEIMIKKIENQNELEKCYELWNEVFMEGKNKDFFQKRIQNHFQNTWGGFIEGELVTASQLFPYTTWYRHQSMTIGGISFVATKAIHRKKGYAKKLLEKKIAWLKQQGFDAANLLTGIPAFYEPMGFIPVEEEWYLFRKKDLPYALENQNVTYITEKEYSELEKIYQSDPQNCANARIRTKRYWHEQKKWRNEKNTNFIVSRNREGKLVAYLRVEQDEGESKLIEACAYPENQEEMVFLCQTWMRNLPENQKITVKVPRTHPIQKWLQKQQIQHLPFQGYMWNFLDEYAILKKVEKEIERKDRRKNDDLSLQIGLDKIHFQYDEKGKLYITNGDQKTEKKIKMTRFDFARLIVRGYDEEKDDPRLKTIFPTQTGILWMSDYV